MRSLLQNNNRRKHRKSILNPPLRFDKIKAKKPREPRLGYGRKLLCEPNFIETEINPTSQGIGKYNKKPWPGGPTNTIRTLAGVQPQTIKTSNHSLQIKNSGINHKTIIDQMELINHQITVTDS